MPRPLNPEVRSRLLSIGRDVVLERGFNGCGVADITEAAGVPKGSFYNYFDSKEAFAVEILEAYWQSIEDRHGPILYDARVKPLVRIGRFFRAITGDHEENGFVLGCLIGNLSLELSNCSEDTRQRLSSLMERWEAALTACLQEAQQRGEFPRGKQAAEVAAILVEAYEGALMRGKVEQSGAALERFEKVVIPLLLA
jgi:TetR/AcrR family transcriptional regulator, transcriptional repressor for nem operon